MRDHHEQDKRLTWRSKRVLATGLGLALFAMTLAVAVHTGRWNAQVAPAAASVAGIDDRARRSGLDATLPGRSVAAAVSPPGATVSASEAPAAAGLDNGDSMAPDAVPPVELSPADSGAGSLPPGLEAAHVGMLAMAGQGGMADLGGRGFGYGYAGPGGGSAGGAGAGGTGAASVGGGSGGGRNLSSATGGSDASGRDAEVEAGAGDNDPDGDGASDGHSGETGNSTDGNNAGGSSANGSNAGGTSTNGNNAGGNSANGNNAGGNSTNGNSAGGNSQDPLAFAGSVLATLPGALTPLGAGDTGQSVFDSAAGETGQVEVPEPATLGMLAFGLAGLGLARRRRASA